MTSAMRCQLIIRIDEFFPMYLGRLLQDLEHCRTHLSSIVLCPQTELAWRFETQVDAFAKRFGVPTVCRTPDELGSLLRDSKDQNPILVLRSDYQLSRGWIYDLIEEASRLPRFASLGAVILDTETFDSAVSLLDGMADKEDRLRISDVGRALRRTPREPALIAEDVQSACTLFSEYAVSILTEAQIASLLSQTKVPREVLETWEHLELRNYATSSVVAYSEERPLANVTAAGLARVLSRVRRGGYAQGTPPILYVLHEKIDGSVGGTEKHTADLVRFFKDERRVYVLHRSGMDLRLSLYFRRSREDFTFPIGNQASGALLSWPDLEELFVSILNQFGIGLIHFQHLMGLPLTLLQLARQRGRTFVTMNDYFLYCENYDFLDKNGQYCGVERDPAVCDRCLAKSSRPYRRIKIDQGDTQRRRAFLEDELRRHFLIYPSESVKRRFHEVYPALMNGPSAVLNPPSRSMSRRNQKLGEGHLNIAFLGVFSRKKGSILFGEIVLHLNKHFQNQIRWHVFGKVADAGTAAMLMGQKNVHFRGEYLPSELPELYEEAEIDLTMILSVWPETYSFTLTEAFACGTPVISTRLGAQGDRVESHQSGWTVDLEKAPQQCEEIVRGIFKSKDAYLQRQSAIPGQPPFNRQAEKFRDIYRERGPRELSSGAIDSEELRWD